MGRDDAVRGFPQRILFRQGLRVCHVERGAPEAFSAVAAVFDEIFERGNEVFLIEDLAAGDVGDEGVALGQDFKLRGGEKVGGFFRQRDRDKEVVNVLRQEVVEGSLIEAGEPSRGDRAVGIAGAGNDEAMVLFRSRGRAGGGGIGDYVHAHCFGNAGDLIMLGSGDRMYLRS